MFFSLPKELQIEISRYLPLKSLASLGRSCKEGRITFFESPSLEMNNIPAKELVARFKAIDSEHYQKTVDLALMEEDDSIDSDESKAIDPMDDILTRIDVQLEDLKKKYGYENLIPFIDSLSSFGNDINQSYTLQGLTLLHICSYMNDVKSVEYLISKGADVDLTNTMQSTALIYLLETFDPEEKDESNKQITELLYNAASTEQKELAANRIQKNPELESLRNLLSYQPAKTARLN